MKVRNPWIDPRVLQVRSAAVQAYLVHHGWKTDAVNLPRVLRSSTNRLPTIAPAEVEVK